MMQLWYDLCALTGLELLQWNFMRNALLAVLIMTPLFGLISTMIVTGKMSFFSDALGHSAFTGIAIGCICGISAPLWVAVLFSIFFALLFSFVRSRSSHTADTLIGVFSSTAVALGIFIATLGGGSFTKYNTYLIGDILSVTPGEIGMLFLVLLAVVAFWIVFSNKMTLTAVHPQLASSRGVSTATIQTVFTTVIAVVVTLAISWVGLLILNSLLVLPAAASRNIARNLKQYHGFSVLFAVIAGLSGLVISYYVGSSAGASICLVLAALFVLTFCFRKAGT
ncbi:MAG: metal ABC transporter permease [Oscillospiraceae bacterium]|nr:metal ABC transporter permease [Oscillospiraceae bacterium]